MMDWAEIVTRLGVATLACGAIGLNRDLHSKPIGLRTLGLVGLATALMVMLAIPNPADLEKLPDSASRILQGVLTGIGFLGAGVIIHTEQQHRVRGLTSAACVWFTACIGAVCGAGHWRLVIVAFVIGLALLTFGGPIERLLRRLLDQGKKAPPVSSPTSPPADV